MGKTLIRDATPDDLDLLMDIAQAMHQESPRFSKLAFSEAKVLQLYVGLMELPNGLLAVAEKDGVVVGGVAGIVTEHWFSTDLTANEFAVFILPEHRGGMTAARLVQHYVQWAKAQGAKLIQLGISTGVQPVETAALYRALGLKEFSVGFEV